MTEPEPDEPARPRLDPDAAARKAAEAAPAAVASSAGSPKASAAPKRNQFGLLEPSPSRTVIDTRKYRWAIGGLGVTLVLVLSVYQFAVNGIGTAGVTAGHRLHWFAAPLATSTLQGDANLTPPCTLAKHDPRALNICLIAKRAPLVLAFFVAGSGKCVDSVSSLQKASSEFPGVQFAAVAVQAAHGPVRQLVRRHRWTIPVAYDSDGAVGQIYGVAICPLIELAKRGGVVQQRLIGEHWTTAAVLAPRVRSLLAAG